MYGSLIIVNTLLMSKALQSKEIGTAFGWKAVSYTHLDVYKRQVEDDPRTERFIMSTRRAGFYSAQSEIVP